MSELGLITDCPYLVLSLEGLKRNGSAPRQGVFQDTPDTVMHYERSVIATPVDSVMTHAVYVWFLLFTAA